MAAIFTEAIDANGNYVNVLTFPPGTGFKCDCICPECGKTVGSRIKKIVSSSSAEYYDLDHRNCDVDHHL